MYYYATIQTKRLETNCLYLRYLWEITHTHTHTHTHTQKYRYTHVMNWSSRLGLLNATTASLPRSETQSTTVLDMAQNNLLTRLQKCLSLWNVDVPLYCYHCTLAWSGNTWKGPVYVSNRPKLCTYAKGNCLK